MQKPDNFVGKCNLSYCVIPIPFYICTAFGRYTDEDSECPSVHDTAQGKRWYFQLFQSELSVSGFRDL